MSDEVRSGCPYCGVGCGLVASTRGGALVEVRGDPDHPVNRGRTCSKPLALPDAVRAPDRAGTPLLRTAPDARLRPAGWDEALGHVAARLRAIVDEHGPDAVAFYLSGQLLTEDYYAAVKLAKGFLGTNTVDSNSRLCMSSAVAGYDATFGADGPPPSYDDLGAADAFLLVGSNAAACHPILWQRIRERQAAGATVIVVDPRRTPTAEGADLHLAVRPGTDLPLLSALLTESERAGLLDRAFLAEHAEGHEEALRAAAAWPAERAARVCGLPAEDIVAAARAFGGAGAAMALWSMGANQQVTGTRITRALLNLCVATGQIGRPGAGPLSLTGQPNAMGGREVGGLAHLLPGYRKVADAEHRRELERLWALPPEAAGISATPGLPATDLFDALEDGRVKAVWIAGTNPVVSMPDAERARAALRRAELVVVQDAYHPTETGALADVVLPAAQWPEKEGTMTNSERRVGLVRKAIEPPGQARPDWEIFAATARALGFGAHFSWSSAAEVHAEFVALTAGRPCDQSGISHERLRTEGTLRWPCPSADHPGSDRLYANGAFATPSGRARLAATPAGEPPDPVDDAFPIVLTTGRIASQWHTMTRTGKSRKLRDVEPEPFLELHPADAARAGVADGARATVRSRRGAVELLVRLDATLPEGTAFAPFHWGALHARPGAGTVNDLSHRATDPVSRQPALKAIAVCVEPVAPRRSTSTASRRLVVVGGGPAGAAVAEHVAAHARPGEWAITIVGAEPGLPYDRVALSDHLAGRRRPEDLELHPPAWYAERAISPRPNERVADVDAASRTVTTSTGDVLSYDALVLATGSSPLLPPIDGLDRSGVFTFRTREDAAGILAAARTARRAVVIGGGLLGIEAARGLAARGLPVTIVHLVDRLMERQLDPAAARMLERDLRRLGIEVLCERATTHVLGDERATGLRFAWGEDLEADLVVLSAGIRPDVALAERAGLEVERGIVVDDTLRTSAPGVWAVGECAQHRGVVHGLWGPILEQARTAGAAIAGVPAGFHGASPATRLKIAELDVFSAGAPAAERPDDDELVHMDTRAGVYRKLVLRGDRLVGAVLLGDATEGPALAELVRSGTPVPDRLLAGAAPGPAAGDDDPATLVCACAGVTRGRIEAAIAADGLEAADQVAAATGAGTGCGSCRGAVEGLLRIGAAPAVR